MGAPVQEKGRPWQFEKTKVRIDKVHIDGLQRTKDDFIVGVFNDLFKANTFADLLEKTIETRLKLEKLGCFKSISTVIDTSSGPKATPDFGYDVTFLVVESGRFAGSRIDMTVENNHGSLGYVMQSPNLAGRGEVLRSEIKYNDRKMPTFNTAFVKPLLFCDGAFSSMLFKQASENVASGYKLTEYGALLSLMYGEIWSHKIEYESTIRNAAVLNRTVAFSVREFSGYTLKSSIRNTFCRDTRDSTVFPISGSVIQWKSEVAGLGGNVGFLKNELFSQLNVALKSNFSLQGSFGAGVLNDIMTDKTYSLVDRFFVGGPLTLRGFNYNSIGPKADGCALGGSLYWIGALHLYTPLPHGPKKGTFGDLFRVHLFANAGTLTNFSSSLKKCFESLSTDIRLTYGIGLAYRLGQIARIELNYCIPVLYTTDDKLMDGFRFGVGVHFM